MASNLATPDALDRPTYPAAEVGRLVGLSSTRVRRWLQGYDYRYADAVHHQDPVIRRGKTHGTSYASFLDLVDLLFVRRFLDHGLSLQKVRKALGEASEILGTTHFARRSFFTDGSNIFLEVKDKGDAILHLLTGGQWAIAPIIQALADQIDFHASSGLARRWYPLGPEGLVVLDPLVSFGRPMVAGRGIATANVFDLFMAENERTAIVRDWLDLTDDEVEAAVEFERRLTA